jgi:hypothetical protein
MHHHDVSPVTPEKHAFITWCTTLHLRRATQQMLVKLMLRARSACPPQCALHCTRQQQHHRAAAAAGWAATPPRRCMTSGASPAGGQPPRATAAGKPRVIVITGPTAVGKSRLGLELAKHLDGEIISADSVQVYRGLDVGSDKVCGGVCARRRAGTCGAPVPCLRGVVCAAGCGGAVLPLCPGLVVRHCAHSKRDTHARACAQRTCRCLLLHPAPRPRRSHSCHWHSGRVCRTT